MNLITHDTTPTAPEAEGRAKENPAPLQTGSNLPSIAGLLAWVKDNLEMERSVLILQPLHNAHARWQS